MSSVSHRRGPKPKPLAERFWSHVEKAAGAGCWMWTASTRAHGYGQFKVDGSTWASAHRVAYELANGPIPEGACVLHRCDVRACVRPDHLFLGSQADNLHDMRAKGRARLPQRRQA